MRPVKTRQMALPFPSELTEEQLPGKSLERACELISRLLVQVVIEEGRSGEVNHER